MLPGDSFFFRLESVLDGDVIRLADNSESYRGANPFNFVFISGLAWIAQGFKAVERQLLELRAYLVRVENQINAIPFSILGDGPDLRQGLEFSRHVRPENRFQHIFSGRPYRGGGGVEDLKRFGKG